jgi:hypothetical protein
MDSKKLLLFLVLIICVSITSYAQILEITRLPVQNASQSIKESAPVWLSENEIMIFYVNESKDSIFSARSNNRGQSWSNPQFEFEIDSLQQTQEFNFPSALKTNSGRLIFAWSVIGEGIHLHYSDNNGTDWSQKQIIIGTGSIPVFQKNLFNIKLSQLDDDRIILCFNPANDLGTLYYKESLNDGVTWSDTAKKILTGGYRFTDHSIISTTGSSLICIFKLSRTLSSNTNIYARFSNDNGVTWGDTINLSGYSTNDILPRITKTANDDIWISYVRTESISWGTYLTFTVGDLFYKKSSDAGITWSQESQLTHFIGDDNYISMNSSGYAPFVSYSTVKFTGLNQIAYGILDESSETFTPPALFYSYSTQGGIPDSIIIRAYVKDDTEVESVRLYFEDSTTVSQLFDDGTHQDFSAGDGIFGNIVNYDFTRYGNVIYFDVNKLLLPFSNKGLIADVSFRNTVLTTFLLADIDNNKSKGFSSIYMVAGSQGIFEESAFLFSSGFFLSGFANGTLWTNAVASATLVEDYLPGTINSNPSDPIFNFYTIQKDDIPFGYFWQKWKDAVSLGAEFYDGDGDGIYEPVDKNWNGTWDLNEDMPLLIGDITAWCVYNDALPKNQRRWNTVDPQGIEIRQTVFADTNPELENVIFIRYSILNTGTVAETMDSVYFGVWEDADVGDHTNDIVGCDTLLNSGFYYEVGPDFIYGDDPPSFFTSILQGPAVFTNEVSDTAKRNFGQLIGSEILIGVINQGMTSHAFFIGGDPFLNDPNNAVEARQFLEGKTQDNNYPNPCAFPYCEVRGGVSCNEVNPHFWASGDPVTDVGWINRMTVDHRNLVSTGPFKLEKDKPQDIIIAYVMGRGTDHFNSITVARENVQRAIQEYESNFASMTYSPPPPTTPVTSYVLYQNYPNPFNPNTTIRYELPQDGVVTIEVFDILGQKIKTLINEFQRADRYEVTFNSTELASGVYIYQLRVNDFITSKKMLLIK